ncbi:MAG: hypothetical protein JW751_19105 [Polyangiaceae bacterium]|nr:hypothetical protein [Polyangiaceae bacterium]
MTDRGVRDRQCIVCISGRPLAGKTTAAAMLHEDRGWPVEEVDALGARLLEADSTAEIPVELDRRRLSYSDAARVEFEAAGRFQEQLRARLDPLGAPIVLVGLRSVSTLRWLDTQFPRRVCLVYVSAGVHVCQRRFATATRLPYREYRRCLESAIECDQEALHRMAQLVVSNHGSLDALRARLRGFIGPNGRAHRTRLEPCSVCGQIRPVHHRLNPDRTPICRKCYEWQLNAEPCSQCHERRPVHFRDSTGRPVCTRCYQRTCNVRICASCGRARPVCCRNLDGDPICKHCRRHGADMKHSRTKPPSSRGRVAKIGTSAR